MELRTVEAIPVEVGVRPLDERGGIAPYRYGHGTVESSARMLVRVETADGTAGWGELNPPLSPAATKAVIETDVADAVVGRQVWETGAVGREFDWVDPYMPNNPALGAVEMAMWDAYGRAIGQPVHRLLGGKCRETVPFAACLGILDPERAREKARELRAMGFSTLKLKGGRDWRDDVERLRAVHGVVGDEMDLRIDPNQNWSVGETLQAVARLETAGVDLQYVEQPIAVGQPRALASLRSRLRTPVAVNEDAYVPDRLDALVDADAVDAAVVDLVPAGGLGGLARLAPLAAARGVSLTHHNSFDFGIKTAAVVHAVASTPAYDLPPDTTYYALADRLIADPFAFADGALSVPDDPGLGVTVDREAVERHRVSL
ncbi:N-acylamino acid racemase [Halobacteriales archaeon QS_1_68_17]|nr:MAG: N-acylamino acid racemase [Halobacteriales archaeon QS_1_68_17]